MTPLFPAQRAAEDFDQVLGGAGDPATTERYADLLETVAALRTAPEVAPRAEFAQDLRSRLMTAAETELAPAPLAVVPRTPVETRRRHRRLGTLAASLVVVGGTAGMAAASSGALPGEGLYPIKRGVEQVETSVRFNQESQGKALLQQASNRLDEVRALQTRGNATDPDVIARTFADFDRAADAGAKKLFAHYEASQDEADIALVRDFAAQQMGVIATIALDADTVTGDLLRDAADTLADIDQQAREACGSCGPGNSLLPPEALAAGAGALTMDNLISRPVTQAKADIAAIQKARAERLEALQQQAESAAGEIPKLPAGSTGTPGTLPNAPGEGPVASAITPDGKLVPVVSTGAAVRDLVGGVTGTLEGTVAAITGGGTLVDGLVGAVGDTLEDTVGGLTGQVPNR